MSVDELLPLLKGVRQAKPHSWIACCPAHEDRTPSLSVAASPTGALLLRCWAGCDLIAITRALGIEVRDLFPRDGRELTTQERRQLAEHRRAAGWAAALRVLAFEASVLLIASADLLAGHALSATDHRRLREAVARIERTREALA